MAKYSVDPYFGDVNRLGKRFKKAIIDHDIWKPLLDEAFDYSMPDRNTFYTRSPGQKESRFVYDSTAVEGLDIFVNKVQSGFFPDWLNWLEFRAGEEIKEEDKEEVNATLEEYTNKFFGHFHQSNFTTEITPTLKDWGVGTGGLEVAAGRIDRDETLFKFKNIPLPELYPENTASGPIRSSWWMYDIELEQILMNWPEADIGKSLEEALKKDPLKKVRLIDGHLYNPKTNTYQQYILLQNKAQHIIYAQEFKTKRRIIFRATKTPGETMGRGPIIRLLSDIRTVNKIVEFYLKNAAIHVAGMFTAVDDGVFNPYNFVVEPGAVAVVSSNNSQNPTLSRMPISGDIQLSQLVLKDIQDRINRALMAIPMGDVNDPVKSATEQMLRHQDDMKRSSTSHGRLYSELIIPMVKACLDIAVGRGKMPDMSINDRHVKIKMVSPLAKQKEMEDFSNSQVFFNMIMQLPEAVAMGTTRLEKLPNYWAEKLDVPLNLVRPEEEAAQVGAALIQASQQITPEGGQPNG
jgi:hypothetical protein